MWALKLFAVHLCLFGISTGRSSCPEHETQVLCKNACSESKCPKREADTLPFACLDVCLGSGCACERNYSRASNGTCIPSVECPPFDCTARPNEMYVACPSSCPSDSCEDIGTTPDSCPRWTRAEECTPACRCVDGYRRNNTGICVPTAECLQCSGPYEEYSESKQSCPNETCAALTSKFECENVEIKPGCVCISGYRRETEDGPCVPMCKCPEMTNAPACINNTD